MRFPSVLALLSAGTLAGAAPAHGEPRWLPPVTIAGEAANAGPIIGASQTGDVAAAWVDGGGAVRGSTRPAGGAFGTPAALGAATSDGRPRFAANPAGQIVSVSIGDGTLTVAVGTTQGGFGAPEAVPPDIAAGAGTDVAVAMADDGTAYLAFLATDARAGRARVVLAARGPQGGYSTIGTLTPPNAEAIPSSVRIAAAGSTVAAAYVLSNIEDEEVSQTRIQAVVVAPGAPFDRETLVDDRGESDVIPAVAIDGTGRALATVTTKADGVTSLDLYERSGSNFGAARRVSAAGTDIVASEVATSPRGDGAVVFTTALGTTTSLLALVRGPGGAFGPAPEVVEVENDAAAFSDALVAFRADGTALVATAATTLGADDEVVERRLLARLRRTDGTYSAPTDVASNPNIADPDLVGDGEGNGVLAWRLEGGGLQAAAFDGAPPKVRGLDVPTAGTAGDALRFRADVLDTWSPAAVRWDFGDGTSADGSDVAHAYGAAGAYGVSLEATDGVGNATRRDAGTVDVRAAAASTTTTEATPTPPAAPPPPGPAVPASAPSAVAPAADRTAPVIDGLRLSRPAMRVAERGTAVAAVMRGTELCFRLSEAADVVVRVERVTGYSTRGRCRDGRGRAGCVFHSTVGRFARRAVAGQFELRLSGRVGRTALRRGRYRLTASARDAAGNRAVPQRVTLEVR